MGCRDQVWIRLGNCAGARPQSCGHGGGINGFSTVIRTRQIFVDSRTQATGGLQNVRAEEERFGSPSGTLIRTRDWRNPEAGFSPFLRHVNRIAKFRRRAPPLILGLSKNSTDGFEHTTKPCFEGNSRAMPRDVYPRFAGFEISNRADQRKKSEQIAGQSNISA